MGYEKGGDIKKECMFKKIGEGLGGEGGIASDHIDPRSRAICISNQIKSIQTIAYKWHQIQIDIQTYKYQGIAKTHQRY